MKMCSEVRFSLDKVICLVVVLMVMDREDVIEVGSIIVLGVLMMGEKIVCVNWMGVIGIL